MSKNCGHTVPCGCADQPLQTKPSCGNTPCPDPDKCPETFCDECVVHCGDSIVDLGILQGMRLDVILQQLTLMITNPGCATPGGPCSAALGVMSFDVMTSTMNIGWLPAANATQYVVEYKEASALSWSLNTAVIPVGGETSFSDTIGGLLPDTEYHVRVLSLCGDADTPETCYSVTILVKTKNQ